MTNFLDFLNFADMPNFNELLDNFKLTSADYMSSPKVNIKETDKAYEIQIANPGIKKDDITVAVEDGILFVEMTSESEEGEGTDDKYHVRQWNKSSYQESWNIPEDVIEDQISAKNTDGVLVITLPKKENTTKSSNARNINID